MMLALLLLLVGATPPSCAPAPSPEAASRREPTQEVQRPETPSPEQLCLHLAPSRSAVILGEPVLLLVGLENCSREPVKVRKLLAPEAGLLIVSATSPGGEEIPYYPAVYRDSRGARSIELTAGDLYVEDVSIYYGQKGWFLDQPGTWTFRAQYSSEAGLLESSRTELTVLEPRGETEQAAARAFMRDEVARFHLLGADGGDAMAELYERFPSSVWGRFANLCLIQAGPSQSSLETELFADLPDAAIAAAAARDLLRRGLDVERSALRELLAGKASNALVGEWIRQCLEE